MIKKLTLTFRDVHLHKDVTIGPIQKISICYNDKADVFVVGGIVYAPIMGNNYEQVLAAVVETPEELSKNPEVKLHVLDKED